MKHLFYLWIFSLTVLAMSQDIQGIVENDPFDPNRGKVEEVVEEGEAVVPIDLPVLSGTIIIGDKRVAMFTYVADGKPSSARASVNDKVAQYTVTGIESHKVQLSTGTGEPITLALYNGKRENRGGSKQVFVPKVVDKAKPGTAAKAPELNKRDPTQTNSAKADEKNADEKKAAPAAMPRKPPRPPRGAAPGAAADPAKRF